MTGLSRRKFLYAGAGVAAVGGIGYLTADYWYSSLKEFYEKTYQTFQKPSPTPTVTQASNEMLTPSPAQTLSPSPAETPTPEKTVPLPEQSEEERQIRSMLEYFSNLYRKQTEKIATLYTDDATFYWWSAISGGQSKKGINEIRGFYSWMFRNIDMDMGPYSFRITDIKVSESKYEATVTFEYIWGAYNQYNCRAYSECLLVDVSKTRPYLKKGTWKIKREYTKIYRAG
ncbi:hypothetical protein KEJ39_04230 [Candidatus Bathyarchaeota archaeon]|nr:hypothetical protein [Candidatus Bathyarchaeota archaeon]